MKKKTAQRVKDEFLDCVERAIERANDADEGYQPFHGKLLSKQIIKLSKFERSFSTSFGQRVIERISKIIAEDVPGTKEAESQKESNFKLGLNCASAIEKHFSSIRGNSLGRAASWDLDISGLSSKGRCDEIRIISDLWFLRHGVNYFFSIKTVKPNIDQAAEAKRDMMKLHAFNSKYKVYFALPYNPYGELKADYKHTPAFKVFNMTSDRCVLIGKEYWDFIGGKDTYKNLLLITEEVGKVTRKRLKNFESN